MTLHVLERDIKEKILIENPVPNNIKGTPSLDTYINKGASYRK